MRSAFAEPLADPPTFTDGLILNRFVENGSLQRTLKQFGELPESLVASYVVKILEGLAYLHAQGVVHCDLKGALPPQ